MWGIIGGFIKNIVIGLANWFHGKWTEEKRAEAESQNATTKGQWVSDIESRQGEEDIKKAQDDAKKEEENKPDNPDDVLNSNDWNEGG